MSLQIWTISLKMYNVQLLHKFTCDMQWHCNSDLLHVTYQLRLLVGHDLVENMVTPLCSQLKSYSGFFQQVCDEKINEFEQKPPKTQLSVSIILHFNSQVSISAEDSFPVVPKWILMNLPWKWKKESRKQGDTSVISTSRISILSLYHSQNVKSYRFWQFWHFQRLLAVG